MNASPLVCVPSKSRESRRLWVIQALVRSMTHLLGRIWKPLGMIASQSTSSPSLTHTARMPVQGWLTISRRTCTWAFTHCLNGSPAYPLSAQINWRRGSFPTRGWSNSLPPSRSPMSAPSTLTEIKRPCVSTSRCRFLPWTFFSAVIASCIAPNRTGFDRLTVENGRTRFGIAPKADANFPSQCGVDLFPDASPFPLTEIQVDRTPVGQIMRQQTPGTPTAQDIQDAIDDFPPLNFLGPSSWLGCGNQGLQTRPFFVCYI